MFARSTNATLGGQLPHLFHGCSLKGSSESILWGVLTVESPLICMRWLACICGRPSCPREPLRFVESGGERHVSAKRHKPLSSGFRSKGSRAPSRNCSAA